MSIGAILTQGLGSFGSPSLMITQGLLPGELVTDVLLGGGGYSYHSPYRQYQEREYEKKTAEAKRQALSDINREIAEAEKLRKLQLAKAERLKTEKALAKLAAEEIRTLEEISRLRMERAWLMRLIDEEEAILVLLMTMPFVA